MGWGSHWGLALNAIKKGRANGCDTANRNLFLKGDMYMGVAIIG